MNQKHRAPVISLLFAREIKSAICSVFGTPKWGKGKGEKGGANGGAGERNSHFNNRHSDQPMGEHAVAVATATCLDAFVTLVAVVHWRLRQAVALRCSFQL